MGKTGIVLVAGAVVALVVNVASARAPYLAEFKAKYTKAGNEEFDKKVEMAGCTFCHAKGKDKKLHNGLMARSSRSCS